MALRKGISFNSRKRYELKFTAVSNSRIIHGLIPPLLDRTVGRLRTSSSNTTYNYKFSITKAPLKKGTIIPYPITVQGTKGLAFPSTVQRFTVYFSPI